MYDGTLKFDTKVDSSGFQSGINKISRIASGGLKATTGIISGAGMAIAGIGTAAIKVGSQFETGMSKVQAISNASAEDMERLTAKAKEMGAKTKFSAGESADAFQYMAMAGWDANEMIDGIAGIMDLAAASGEDLASTSDIVTDALTAFGLKAEDAGEFADILAQASSNANTNVGMMGETFKYVAPVAGAMGFNAQDTATAIGLMANAGIKAGQAGTSLRSILTRMAKPTTEVQDAMDKLGISITNSDGSMKDLNTIMKDLRKGFKNLSTAEKTQMAAALGGQEAMSGLLAIVEASDEDFDSLSESIYNSEGAAQRMAETMMDNLPGALEQAKGGLETFGLALYEELQDPAKEAVLVVVGMIDDINAAFEEDGFAGLSTAFGDALATLAQDAVEFAPTLIQSGADVITSFLSGLNGHDKEFGDAGAELITSLSTAIVEVSGSLWTTGLNLLTAILQGMAENPDEIGIAIATVLSDLGTAITEDLPIIWESGKTIIQGIIDGMSQEFPGASAVLSGFFEGFSSTAEFLIQPVVDVLTGLFEAINSTDPDAARILGEAIGTIAAGVAALSIAQTVAGPVSALLGVLSSAGGAIKGLVHTGGLLVEGFALWAGGAGTFGEVIALQFPAIAAFGGKIAGLAGTVVAFVQKFSLVTGIGTIIGGAILAVTSFVEQFQNGFSIVSELLMALGIAIAAVGAVILGAPAAVAAVVAGIVFAVANLALLIKEHWDQIVEFFVQLPGNIAEFLGQAVDKIIEWGAGLIEAASSAVSATIEAIVNFFSGLPYKIGYWLGFALGKLIQWGADAINWVVEEVPKIIEDIVQFFAELPGKVWEWLCNTVDNVIQWGADMLEEATTAASEFFDEVISFFEDLPGEAWEWLCNTVDKVIEWGADMVEEATTAAEDFVEDFVDKLEDLPSEMWDLGCDIIGGIWDGIVDNASDFFEDVYDFFAGIVDGAKDALDINSPSKVLADEVGKFIPPGVGVGIEKAMPALLKQTDKDFEALTARMKGAVSLETDRISIESGARQAYKAAKERGQAFDDSNSVSFNGVIHTHVELDGEEVGRSQTPIVDKNMNRMDIHKERGG